LAWVNGRAPPADARFRRNGRSAISDYVERAMTYALDIDTRIARLCLHAGRLQAGG
jgi:hypothetical protein